MPAVPHDNASGTGSRRGPGWAGRLMAVACGVSLGGVPLGGCAGKDLNARAVLGGALRLTAFEAGAPVGAAGLVDDEPSLRTVSRAEWAGRRFEVPVDGTVHTAIRRWSMTPAGGNPRRSGLWPTLESSLRVSDAPGRALSVEAWTAWAEALGEVVCLPLEVLMAPGIGNAGNRASPWAMYKRYPETGEWTSVSAADVRPKRQRGERPETAEENTDQSEDE